MQTHISVIFMTKIKKTKISRSNYNTAPDRVTKFYPVDLKWLIWFILNISGSDSVLTLRIGFGLAGLLKQKLNIFKLKRTIYSNIYSCSYVNFTLKKR